VRFLLLPSLLAAALAVGGCASSEKQLAKMEQNVLKENSRSTEERRMRAMTQGDVASTRGAEILVVDPYKKFDASRSGIGTVRPYGTGSAQAKDFNFQQKTRARTFNTRDYAGSKPNSATERAYATGEANTKGKYQIPNSDKEAGQRTAATREWRDGTKVAATQDLRDGKRPYLGPESAKLGKSIDPKTLGDWRSAGSEAVVYGGSSVERMGNLKQLSIDDVRELLNKSK
jgi:hypothetical protein